ncbi:MAG: ABC transporter substrate-binding protein [Tissierellia bacterium]|nr:ABC transporter substrate-binding protein [Tissierellia bacterium]
MKRFKIMWLAIALMLMLSACSSGDTGKEEAKNETTESSAESTGSGDKIKVGGLGPLTGDVAIYGVTATNGVKLAFEEINANGGILGKEVEFVLYDEKGDPTEAVTAYNRLVDEGIDALIGSITSKPTLAVAEVAKNDGIPMITPTGTQKNITEGKDNVFRTCFIDPFQGVILAKFAKNDLNAKTVAVISNTSDDYSIGVKDAFIKEAEAQGLEVVADEGYGASDSDFKSQLTKMVGLKPDVLVIPDYYKVVALITSQAREVGLESTFIGPDGWDGVLSTLDASNIDVVDDSYFTNHFSVKDEADNVKKFVESYKEEFGEEPSAFAALGYDTAYILKEAMEKAGSTDKAAVVDAIKNIEFNGVTGKLRFDEENNPIKAVTIMKTLDGEYLFNSVVE